MDRFMAMGTDLDQTQDGRTTHDQRSSTTPTMSHTNSERTKDLVEGLWCVLAQNNPGREQVYGASALDGDISDISDISEDDGDIISPAVTNLRTLAPHQKRKRGRVNAPSSRKVSTTSRAKAKAKGKGKRKAKTREASEAERPFVCGKCDKRFTSKYILQRHDERHTNVRAFPCNECDYRAKTRNDLLRHKEIHDEKS